MAVTVLAGMTPMESLYWHPRGQEPALGTTAILLALFSAKTQAPWFVIRLSPAMEFLLGTLMHCFAGALLVFQQPAACLMAPCRKYYTAQHPCTGRTAERGKAHYTQIIQ